MRNRVHEPNGHRGNAKHLRDVRLKADDANEFAGVCFRFCLREAKLRDCGAVFLRNRVHEPNGHRGNAKHLRDVRFRK